VKGDNLGPDCSASLLDCASSVRRHDLPADLLLDEPSPDMVLYESDNHAVSYLLLAPRG
jgi:hypothetical protein